MKRTRTLSPLPKAAARLFGARIREARINRHMSLVDLAQRTGASEITLRKVERGDPTVSLGIAFEAAAIVGVPLFDESISRVEREMRHVDDRLSLLPKTIRKGKPVNADF